MVPLSRDSRPNTGLTNEHRTGYGVGTKNTGDDNDNVFTILRVPMDDAWGKYYRQERLMLLADDLTVNESRQLMRLLFAGHFQPGTPAEADCQSGCP